MTEQKFDKGQFVDIYKADKKYNVIYADPPWRYQDKGCRAQLKAITTQ